MPRATRSTMFPDYTHKAVTDHHMGEPLTRTVSRDVSFWRFALERGGLRRRDREPDGRAGRGARR